LTQWGGTENSGRIDKMKKLLFALLVVAGVYYVYDSFQPEPLELTRTEENTLGDFSELEEYIETLKMGREPDFKQEIPELGIQADVSAWVSLVEGNVENVVVMRDPSGIVRSVGVTFVPESKHKNPIQGVSKRAVFARQLWDLMNCGEPEFKKYTEGSGLFQVSYTAAKYSDEAIEAVWTKYLPGTSMNDPYMENIRIAAKY